VAKQLRDELEKLRTDVLRVGTLVEEAVRKSLAAFEERDRVMAEQIIAEDNIIDQREVEIEEECLKILALQQPVAEDLRFIAAVLKINNDLERMGDCAVHIAKRTRSLSKGPAIQMPKDLKRMSVATLKMVRDCLDAFAKRDAKLAQSLAEQDDVVDDCNHSIIRELRERMHNHPDEVDPSLDLFTTTRRLERIGDLATNVAEDVLYLVSGEIVRHRSNENPIKS